MKDVELKAEFAIFPRVTDTIRVFQCPEMILLTTVESDFQKVEETVEIPKVADAVVRLVPYAEPNMRTNVLPEATNFEKSVLLTKNTVASNNDPCSKHP